MRGERFSRWGVGLLAGFGVGLCATTSVAAFAAEGDTAFVMGGSGNPIPAPSYLDAVSELYLRPLHLGAIPQALFTPESFYPVTGIKTLPADTSLAQGVTILHNAVTAHLGGDDPDGGGVVVFGFSQSATISSLEMRNLAALPPDARPHPDDLSFVLAGDPSNPNGGLLERFNGLYFPSLGQTFSGATPDDLYPTTIYTQEYDGFADFPRYPINLLADLNAVLGILYVHGTYADLTAEQVENAIALPTVGTTMTDYFMIPTTNLPLLEPLRAVAVVGDPLADLLQPDLRVIVNLGYGDPNFGWSTSAANVPTPFGLFPDVDLAEVISDLARGAEQGIHDAMQRVAEVSTSSWGLSDLLAPNPAPPTDIVSALSGALASAYATLLPTADILVAGVVSLPMYDVDLFLDQLAAGSLLNAIGYPLAADIGLITVAAGFELDVLTQAARSIAADLGGVLGF